jgi:8-oxo-dGTP diphosphatase
MKDIKFSTGIRIGVGVIIKNGNKILLGKRAIDKLEDGVKKMENHVRETWSIPGGKLELGEKLADCAKRETLEETGLIVNDLKLIAINDATAETGFYLVAGFASEDFKGEPKTLEPNKIGDWQWFDLDNLPTPLFGPSEETIQKFKDTVIY